MNVRFSDAFKAQLPTFADDERKAVLDFVAHVKQHGLRNLAGRNKSSVPENPHTKKQIERAKYAQKHCLWHYESGKSETAFRPLARQELCSQ